MQTETFRIDWDQWQIVDEKGAPVADVPEHDYDLFNLMYWRVHDKGHEILISEWACTWEEAQALGVDGHGGRDASLIVQGYEGQPFHILVASPPVMALERQIREEGMRQNSGGSGLDIISRDAATGGAQ